MAEFDTEIQHYSKQSKGEDENSYSSRSSNRDSLLDEFEKLDPENSFPTQEMPHVDVEQVTKVTSSTHPEEEEEEDDSLNEPMHGGLDSTSITRTLPEVSSTQENTSADLLVNFGQDTPSQQPQPMETSTAYQSAELNRSLDEFTFGKSSPESLIQTSEPFTDGLEGDTPQPYDMPSHLPKEASAANDMFSSEISTDQVFQVPSIDPHETTPPIWSTPPLHEVTPEPKEPSPPPREPTPPPKQTTPPLKEATPPPRQPTPVVKEPTPPPRESTSSLHEPSTQPVDEPFSSPVTTGTTKRTVESKSSGSIEIIKAFNTLNPCAWFDPQRLNLKVEQLIYWRDVKKSGIVFGNVLVVLLSLSYFSLISVIAYLSLAVISVTLSFRVYKSVLQAIQKTKDGHPFKEYLEMDIALSSEKVHEVSDIAISHINWVVSELRRLFLVEDLVDSIKFGILLWCLTYVGAWFNGLTLHIIGFVALFTLPKVYENNKTKIDQNLDLVKTKINEITANPLFSWVKAVIPLGKKEKEQ